jgi:prepilin-type N-terminal cleavage/methylation domain-containing protein
VRAALRRRDGFTLVEIVISMCLIGVLFAIFAVTMGSTIDASSEVQEDSALQGEVRATVDALANELRQAYTGNGTPAIETMTATKIQFLSPDRGTPLRLRRIVYRLQAKKIERAAATSTNTGSPPWSFPGLGPYVPQVGSVTGTSVFTYRDAAGAIATDPADVASVTVSLQVAAPQAPNRKFTNATSVALRVAQ